jgi:cytochrome P450
MRLSLTASGRALFGADLRKDADTIIDALDAVQAYYAARPVRIALDLMDILPGRDTDAVRDAVAVLRRALDRLIADRQNSRPTDNALDLLDDLLDAGRRDALSPGTVRNAVMAALLSSYETTGCALTWALTCLARHEEDCNAIATEAAHLPAKVRCGSDLMPLAHTRRVFKEAMRLYPPSWIIVRETRTEQWLGAYRLRKSAPVLASPYLLHRRPKSWNRPGVFDADRFRPAAEGARSDAFIPFGAGPHACFGAQFATNVAQLVLARLAARYALRATGNASIRPRALLSLQPRDRSEAILTLRNVDAA